jgi:AcrR family transcriptional regulator
MPLAPDARGSRRRSAQATRDKLLLAAVELFAEQGYSGIRVRHIAARAGVTTGAIYAHYNDVASLLADAAGRAVDHAVRALAEVLPGELASVLRSQLATTSEGGLSREQSLLLEAFVAARREDPLREVLSRVMRERLVLLESAIIDAQSRGEIRPDLPAGALAWYLYLLPVGLLAGRAVELTPPDRQESIAVFDALFHGLATRSAPAGDDTRSI